MRGLLVQKSESLADDRVARAGEPAGLVGRQRVDVAPQRLDEQHFRQLGQHQPAARIRSAPFADREPDGVFQPLARGFVNDMHFQNRRQASQKDLAQPRLAGHESAHESGDLAAAAKVRDFEPLGQVFRKGPEGIHRFFG